MLKLPLALFLAALAACSSAADTTHQATAESPHQQNTPASQPSSECNFETALIPGVPGSPGNLIKSARKPSGDSELSFRMRGMVDDLREVRDQLRAKQPIKKLHPTHRRIRCSWHTEPAGRTKDFDTRAQGYLAIVKAFDESPSPILYDAMITGCVSCHTVTCPGPLEFIGQLRY